MSEYRFLIEVILCMVVSWVSLAAGFWMHKVAHKDGVKLVDRIRHDQEPYDEYEEKRVQQTTGGDFNEV